MNGSCGANFGHRVWRLGVPVSLARVAKFGDDKVSMQSSHDL